MPIIACYIRLFQSYCSTRYGSILRTLHNRGFNHFCITWNKGTRRMLKVSNMTHTPLLGLVINTCHISIQLGKRFCKFADFMMTSRNAIVRDFVRRAINSAQLPIGRKIAVIPHLLYVLDIVNHVHGEYHVLSVSQSRQEPIGVCWSCCGYPITRLIYPGLPKLMVIL